MLVVLLTLICISPCPFYVYNLDFKRLQPQAKYLFVERDGFSCDTFAIYDTDPLLFAFNAGWLYNLRVERSKRKQIDRELLDLVISDKMRKIFTEKVDNPESDCVREKKNVGGGTIVFPIGIFVVLPVLIMLVTIIRHWRQTRRVHSEGNQSDFSDSSISDNAENGEIVQSNAD